MIPFWQIFFRWVVQPPTRKGLKLLKVSGHSDHKHDFSAQIIAEVSGNFSEISGKSSLVKYYNLARSVLE